MKRKLKKEKRSRGPSKTSEIYATNKTEKIECKRKNRMNSEDAGKQTGVGR